MDDPIKQAEARGYSKGYAAGQRRLDRFDAREEMRGRRDRFVHDAFLAVLPTCIEVRGWTRGDKPITGRDDRIDLAWEIAESALKKAKFL